jgi:ubiquinone/menaquinone biosynthesis C-methylase UbiE
MAEKFDPAHWESLEDPQRLVELPPDVVVDLLDLEGAETIVDFGAGTGAYTFPVAAAVAGGSVVALDESPALLDRLIDKLADAEPALSARIEPVLTDDGPSPLPDHVADRLLAVNVAHHVHDEPQALEEMTRLLRPGGRAVVVDYGHVDRPIGPPKDHVLTHDRLREFIRDLGLDEVAVHEPGTLLEHHIVVVAEKPSA